MTIDQKITTIGLLLMENDKNMRNLVISVAILFAIEIAIIGYLWWRK